jgi:predicted Zn-dependent protease
MQVPPPFSNTPIQLWQQLPAMGLPVTPPRIEAQIALPLVDLENVVPIWQEPLSIPIYCDLVDDQETHPPEAFEKAMLAWQTASKGSIQFKRLTANTANDDGIFISWSDETNPQRPYEVGRTVNQTHLKEGHPFIYRSEIVLQRNPRINQHLDVDAQQLQLYATFLHEMGHALGLEHTQDPHSVMFHRSLQNHQFTTEDLAQLKRLY